jgi:hypothetical protein
MSDTPRTNAIPRRGPAKMEHIREALRLCAKVFEDMDSIAWDGGQCPVSYHAAQTAVNSALNL